jgi:putative hydrolase of the HAD superfamily
VTNTHWAELVTRHLDAIGIRECLRAVVTSIEHGRPKPHPSIFEAALSQLRCTAARTLFVGDSHEANYVGSKRAGMRALLIDPSGESRAPRADLLDSVLDLRDHSAVHSRSSAR